MKSLKYFSILLALSMAVPAFSGASEITVRKAFLNQVFEDFSQVYLNQATAAKTLQLMEDFQGFATDIHYGVCLGSAGYSPVISVAKMVENLKVEKVVPLDVDQIPLDPDAIPLDPDAIPLDPEYYSRVSIDLEIRFDNGVRNSLFRIPLVSKDVVNATRLFDDGTEIITFSSDSPWKTILEDARKGQMSADWIKAFQINQGSVNCDLN